MDKPEIVRISPHNIDEEIKGAHIRGLCERGWTIQTSLILEDPRQAADSPDRVKLALILFPPHEGRGQVVVKASEAWQIGIGILTGLALATAAYALIL